MSKKLAAGSDIIVLDVKTGSGAFMKELPDAEELAETMVSIGVMAGKKIAAVITEMDQPLGNAVGNSLEVIEAVEALSGKGPKDLMEVVYALGSQILLLADVCRTQEEAIGLMCESVASGAAKRKLAEFIEAQGGDASYVYDTSKFERAVYAVEVLSRKEGFVSGIQAEVIGNVCMMCGGGRKKKGDAIDLSVGILLQKKRGDFVKKGETLAVVYVNSQKKGELAAQQVASAYAIGETEPQKEAMVKKVIKGSNE